MTVHPARCRSSARAAIMLAAAALLLGACTAAPRVPPATVPSPVQQGLLDIEWQLIELDGQPVSSPPPPRGAHLVLMSADARVAGSGGCNRLMGRYRIEGEGLRFDQLASTMMACADGMAQEQAFTAALGQVVRWRMMPARLELLDAQGQPRLRLARQEAERMGRHFDGPAWSATELVYRCAGGEVLQVAYLNASATEHFAALYHAGQLSLLQARPTASGARYVSLDEERGLRWYTRGDAGFLNFMAADHTASEVRVLSDCKVQPLGD
jgi:heat shock protein HslJ